MASKHAEKKLKGRRSLSGRTSQNASRRNQILDVAARLFQQRGFRSTSLEDVASELGVTRPALYYYFLSKNDLLAAIYERGVNVLLERAARVLDDSLPHELQLRRLVEVHVHTMLEELPTVTVFFQEKAALSSDLEASIREKEVSFTKIMAAAIRAGQERGVFRPGDPELIVNAILGMLIWIYRWHRPARHGEEAIVETFWGLLSRGLILPVQK